MNLNILLWAGLVVGTSGTGSVPGGGWTATWPAFVPDANGPAALLAPHMSLGVDGMTDTTALLAAQVQLMVLRASLPLEVLVRGDGVFLTESAAPIQEAKAAEILASMIKPLKCAASLRGSHMAVTCQEATAEDSELHDMYVSGLDRGEGLGVVSTLATRPDERILIVGREESLLVPLTVLRRWYADYLLLPPVALDGRPPNDEERSRGAVYVIAAGRYDVVDPDSLPPDVRRFLIGVDRKGPP